MRTAVLCMLFCVFCGRRCDEDEVNRKLLTTCVLIIHGSPSANHIHIDDMVFRSVPLRCRRLMYGESRKTELVN